MAASSSEGFESSPASIIPRTEVASKSLLAFVRDESSSHRDFYTSHVSDMSHIQQKQDHLLTLFRVPFKVEKVRATRREVPQSQSQQPH